jgi:LysM repeat protein
VKPGHTLYSICKAYGVTQDEIIAANPGVVISPLSVGIVLKIPVTEKDISISGENNTKLNRIDTNFIYHTVQPKENIYFLHLKYNVPLEDIYKYNPGSETGIQIGQVIKIPKRYLIRKTDFQAGIGEERIIKYVVRDNDTLYRIAQTYGITIEDLINANESLRWGLKTGQIINIPLSSDISNLPILFSDSIFRVSTVTRLNNYQCDSIADSKGTKRAIKVAVLLPFFTNDNYKEDSFTSSDTLSGFIQTRSKSFRGRPAAEFYEGMLLALDSLKKTDITISVFVYDTEADSNKVRHILKDLDIIEPDLIFGPFEPENVLLVSIYSFERKIPFVPPLTYLDSDLVKNPYLFTVIPSDELLNEQFINYISKKYQDNFICITKTNSESDEESADFFKMLSDRINLERGTDTSALNRILLDDLIRTNLINVLQPDCTNRVIVLSDYEPDVITALSHLHFLSREYPIQVYGFPAWQKFDNVRFDVLHELEVCLYSPFFIDYSETPVKLFVNKCRQQLHSEPYKTTSKGNGINYTYLGYDLTMYFFPVINTYKENTCDCIENFNTRLLLSDYAFKRINNQDGFINTSMNIITFEKDYTVSRIRLSGR